MDTNLGAEQRDADPAESREGAEELPALARMVAADALFDEAFYARALGISGSRLDLVTHYLTTGEAAMLSPSPDFDVRFYREANPDVAQGGGSALLHYLVHGREERRYPNRRALRRDAERVTASGLFDARAYAWDRGRPARPGLSDVEDYLVGRNHRAPIGEAFDGAFYAGAYEDVLGEASGYAMPILHYIDVGRTQLRVCTERELLRHMQEKKAHFNERYYLDQYQRQFAGQPLPHDALRHYILTGSRLGLDPAPNFSGEYYLRRYPDLRQSGVDPFFHYATYGASEGRVGRPDFSASITRGEAEFDSGKPTLLVASHEASRTGAPLVGLNVGAAFADTHNVVAYLGTPGPLLRDFAARSCAVVTGPLSALDAEYLLRELKATHQVSAVLLNSVETDAFAPAALQADLPSVALVHEFAEYTLPTGRMSAVVELVDRVITPASLIRDSVQAELLATRSGRANNLTVRPQGYLPNLPGDEAADDLTQDDIRALIGAAPGPGTKVKVVLGAGRVQMRKGVDLFVQTAAEARRLAGDDIRFVWVGDGYSPGTDVHYSAWIADMVRRLDLEGHVFFLPAQSSLQALFAVSDVFYLPSRLDPFPNVALDALRAGRAVVCFDRATGVVDALSDAPGRKAAVGAAVAYCDVTRAAEALVRMLQPAEAKRALGNAALAQRSFAFADYVAAIAEQLTAAAALREAAVRTADAILASGRFDAAFHDNLPAPAEPPRLRAAIREYVARSQKGIVACNPCPGFNEGVARLRLAQPGPALAGPDISPTHRCVVLRDDPPPAFAGLRTALHLHLHYPELAGEFAARLSAARGSGQTPVDLILTTTSDARRIEVEYAFRGYKGGSTRLVVAPNRGRDIGPFLTEVGALVQAGQYDVVGHLHGKRSLAVDAGLGDCWRSFLLDTLLGGAGGLPAVLSLFGADPDLGLVFAEDRHCVGWSKNRPIADALAARMQPAPVLPEWPVFPIGTMFWARPAALAPLWALGLGPQDWPGEPVAYDGTVLHAVERMLPAVCESTGHGWCTVHREGAGW
jgi:glycosyltransferase involved in cell wall biosynthesis